MKNKWSLIGSIFQLVVGLLAIISFLVLTLGGENTTRWIITVILAVAYVVLGIIGIVDYNRKK